MNKDFKEREVLDKINCNDSSIEDKIRYALFSSKSQSCKCDLLMDLIQIIPTKLWFELAIDCVHELPSNYQKEVCNQITAIFKEGELFSKNDSIEIFKKIEGKTVSMGLNGTSLSELIPSSASFLNNAVHDNRYKLFSDFGYVYYTTDIEKLKSAVVELNELYEKGGSPEAVRSYAYLLTVAQFRLACLLYPKSTISRYNLSEAYDNCFDSDYDIENYDFVDDDDDTDDFYEYTTSSSGNPHYISSIPERITRCDCIEIVRIFDPHLYYISAELLQEIHKAVREVSDRNRYENEIAPIVAKSCLFVINSDN